jgi:hypothetical protein
LQTFIIEKEKCSGKFNFQHISKAEERKEARKKKRGRRRRRRRNFYDFYDFYDENAFLSVLFF